MPEKNTLIVQGKPYNLTVAPTYQDPLVKAEVAKVLGQLNLRDITDNLYMSVELIFVAYNGVAGADGGKIQSDIAEIQSDLALLCNKCVNTMSTFENETKNIITQLVSTYKWLTKGKEELAFKKFAHCKDSSRTMSESAHGLADEFRVLQVKSTKARSNSIRAEASERDKKLAAEEAERDIKEKQVAAKANQEELVAQVTQMQALYNDAKHREEKAQDKAMILGITSAITGALGAGLGAYAAARNPIGTAMANANTGGGGGATPDPRLADAQRKEEEKKRESGEAEKNLLAAKDERDTKQATVNKLQSEVEELNKQISDAETEAATDETALNTLKESRTAKQTELKAAEKELATANDAVKPLEKKAKDLTAEYAAAGTALSNIAQSTNQMAQSAASAEESIHQEKMQFLNKKLELEKEKRKSLVALAEYAEQVKNLKVVQGMATVSVNSLHAAVEALGKIIGTLTNAALFWDQMSKYCERMTEQGFQQEIADITGEGGLTKEERLEYYYDVDFMKLFLEYMCQWSAINGLSGEYLVAASNAQKKAVEYLNSSPTIEQALKQAPALAKSMGAMVGQSLLDSRNASVELEQEKARLEAQPVAVAS